MSKTSRDGQVGKMSDVDLYVQGQVNLHFITLIIMYETVMLSLPILCQQCIWTFFRSIIQISDLVLPFQGHKVNPASKCPSILFLPVKAYSCTICFYHYCIIYETIKLNLLALCQQYIWSFLKSIMQIGDLTYFIKVTEYDLPQTLLLL